MRPNVVTAPQHAWDDFAFLGLIDNVDRGDGGTRSSGGGGATYQKPKPTHVTIPPPGHVTTKPPTHVTTPPTHGVTQPRKIDPKTRFRPPIQKPQGCAKGYVYQNGKCVVTVPKCDAGTTWDGTKCVSTCKTGTAWDGSKCVPSGTECQAPNVLDAAGNCVLPSKGTCPTGYVLDTAGYCTADPRNPYSLYLPDSSASGGGATPASVLPTCASGQFDAQGNCIPPTIWDWLKESTIIPGVENMFVAGGGLLAAFLLFHKKAGKR